MLTERLTQFPPSFNVERFMADLFQHTDRPDAMALVRHRDAQALDDAEFAHGPSICTEDGCTELRCVAYHRAITDRLIVAAHPSGFQVAS